MPSWVALGTGFSFPAFSHLASAPIRAIAFRDYLRAHTNVAGEYEVLKRRLAQEHRLDREAYTQAKRPFIDCITDIALQTSARIGSVDKKTTDRMDRAAKV